ncbi:MULTISPECIES: SsgA family sporulation/cell division regulator [Streptomyces]|uniref:SsgA family sporulation/cell division regulator n=1 Tax=Streptomyces sudanensis TaxID=436397 RepID=A0ABY4TE04_9ACTN|nr:MULTISPECIES: SsgA family sporulation/cell division regulator [Streptomyces]MCP9958120.1 SsgA family sporulation/cell division regulator [Streptomyces sudanensis]MCP9987231.1 SsgA family sporulation/cell division regulator [Streptomyces sudanensis]MCQ0001358.1 SsgA family sporulation/cell division regulator [Streptomyces sudanensis]URN16957.1 SsgA family sporulation/cell division regulator [Streptomyces sudanensis]
MNAVLHDKLFMRLHELPVLAHMTYDETDPYAVRVAFTDGEYVYAEWRLDREMLREGMRHEVGEGDVRIWPGVHIELCGEADFTVGEEPLARFLERTYEVVPEGEERVDVDGLVDRLLTAG